MHIYIDRLIAQSFRWIYKKPMHILGGIVLVILCISCPAVGFSMILRGVALIDRDGVINKDVGPPGVLEPNQLELTPNAGDAISLLNDLGFKCCVITNQSCVGKGLISEAELVSIHDILKELLLELNPNAKLHDIFYCTSLNNSVDPRMKPYPGMIFEACQKYNVTPNECFMIGDSIRDLVAAASAGVPLRILVETGYGRIVMNNHTAPEQGLECIDSHVISLDNSSIFPFYYGKNLYESAKWISTRPLSNIYFNH